jgi:hypothetical protein
MPEIIRQSNVISGKGTLYNPPIKIDHSAESVIFGRYCAIAPNLKIFGSNHDYNFPCIQGTICVGTPCKSVKLRYSKEIINFLLDLKWWNWDDAKIKRNKEFFMTDLNEITDINQIHII